VAPSKQAVQSIVVALFTLQAGLERARRQKQAAAALSILQVIASRDGMRPSDIADQQLAHRSQVTRQIRELEDAGYVEVTADPDDGRSWLVALSSAGREQMWRLQQQRLERFALFVAGWDEAEVRVSQHCWTSSGCPSLPPPNAARARLRARFAAGPRGQTVNRTARPVTRPAGSGR